MAQHYQPSNSLFLYGMHRSGTSIAAKMLHEVGINMGDLQLEKSSAIPGGGHSEDLDFLAFHKDLLNAFNSHDYLVSKPLPTLPLYFEHRASHLVNLKNSLRSQWGVKEPRLCLTCKLWTKLCPNATKIILYRNPEEVVRSIKNREKRYKRGLLNHGRITAFIRTKLKDNTLYSNDSLHAVWEHYNNELLKTFGVDEQTLFTTPTAFEKHFENILDWLQSLGFSIQTNQIQHAKNLFTPPTNNNDNDNDIKASTTLKALNQLEKETYQLNIIIK